MADLTWSRDVPAANGWYWVRYKAHGADEVVCPAEVVHIDSTTRPALVMVYTRGANFSYGLREGTPEGPRYRGKVDKTLRYGPAIPYPAGVDPDKAATD